MKYIITLPLLFINALAIDYQTLFNDFKNKYNKIYNSVNEQQYRLNIFIDNYKYINEHNNKNLSYTLGINHLTDLKPDELTLGYNVDFGHNKCSNFNKNYEYQSLPTSIDWRDRNAVTSVKNQGQCGSCWSFSATGAMEGSWAISEGELISLSEQQLVDCSSGFGSYGNHGCNGGLMDYAFDYAIDNGMCIESEYKYTAKQETCNNNCKKYATFSSCQDVKENNQQDLTAAVAQQPVSVAIEADTREFQLYESGVITGNDCGTNLDHGVLIVGYGNENGQDYWLVKNSWGTEWGDSGYVKIARSSSINDIGICGIASTPSFPIV